MKRALPFANLLLLAGSAAEASSIQILNPEVVARPVGAYSHLAVVPPGTRLLYLAGQIGNRPDGSLPTTVEEQFVQALENVRLILASQGARPEDVVKLTYYVAAKPKNWGPIRDKRTAMFPGPKPPPGTWVYVPELIKPEYLVEIDAVAAVPDQRPIQR